jgi:hypothetical protein
MDRQRDAVRSFDLRKNRATEQGRKNGETHQFSRKSEKGSSITDRAILIHLLEDATVIHLLEDLMSTAVNSRQIRNKVGMHNRGE